MENRTLDILGTETYNRLQQLRIAIFGIGGVGSWCVESLARSGVQHLILIDGDRINQSNINRQIHSTTKTIGEWKVNIMRDRILEIDPTAIVEIHNIFYNEENANIVNFNNLDYVVDAIDDFENKMLLIRNAQQSSATLISSMGAARRLDPSKVKTADFWKVNGCPLAKKLRKHLKNDKDSVGHFTCVYSDEPPKDKGSIMHVTATFGLTIASLIVQNTSSLSN